MTMFSYISFYLTFKIHKTKYCLTFFYFFIRIPTCLRIYMWINISLHVTLHMRMQISCFLKMFPLKSWKFSKHTIFLQKQKVIFHFKFLNIEKKNESENSFEKNVFFFMVHSS